MADENSSKQYAWIENKTNRNGKKVHRHEGYPYWHDPEQKHENSKRTSEEKENISQSPSKRQDKQKEERQHKDNEKKDSDKQKQSKENDKKHKNYTIVNHKKYKSLKQKLYDRAINGTKFNIPKFTPAWCIWSSMSALAQIFDKAEELYDKYSKSPHSKAGKILQYKSNGYEDAMKIYDKIVPPEKKDWSFEDTQTADKLLTKEIKGIYQQVADRYNLSDWKEGLALLNDENRFGQVLKKDPQYLYRIREEAYTLGQARQKLRQSESQTAQYQQKRKAGSVQINRRQAGNMTSSK